MEATDPNMKVAARILQKHGSGAVGYLLALAEHAKAFGDMDTTIAWWDIALAAIELRGPSGDADGRPKANGIAPATGTG